MDHLSKSAQFRLQHTCERDIVSEHLICKQSARWLHNFHIDAHMHLCDGNLKASYSVLSRACNDLIDSDGCDSNIMRFYAKIRHTSRCFLCFLMLHEMSRSCSSRFPAGLSTLHSGEVFSRTTCSLVKSWVSSRLQHVRHVQLEIINLTLSSVQKLRLHLFSNISPLQTADQEAKSQRSARLSAIHPIYLATFSLEVSSSEPLNRRLRCRLAFCAICFCFLTFSSWKYENWTTSTSFSLLQTFRVACFER